MYVYIFFKVIYSSCIDAEGSNTCSKMKLKCGKMGEGLKI